MRARVVFHDGTNEKPTEVGEVVEYDDRIELTIAGFTSPLTYPKDKVAFFQVVWHG